jgi:predicted Zn finger-like uncharacterized protein
MLFTRCPGCQTTFRITADTLRVANGAVRCGSCATVFSAFSGLQQNTLEDDRKADDEFLSPTLQMQELASLEELASPELDDTPAAEPEDAPEAAAEDPQLAPADDEPSELDALLDAEDSEPDIPIVDTRAEVEQDPAQDTEADSLLEADSPFEPEEGPASETRTPDQQSEREAEAEAAAGESSDELQFEAPADNWAELLSEIEQSTDQQPGTDEETSDGDRDSAADEPHPDNERPWNVGDPAAPESWHEIELPGDEHTGHERVAVGEAETALDIDEPVAEAGTDSDLSALLDAEPGISAEQVDATLSAEPDPDLVEALEARLPSDVAGDKLSLFWTVGTAALALVLAFQAIHHFRAPLAGGNLAGPLVQGVYGVFGVELVPEWDLDQYEILNWVATEAGLGNLRISAQIRNNGPLTQPYPYIHLELKDRWEAVVGSRVFEPAEYLEPDADLSNLMVSGVTVPADFAVVDPGEDAYGFELDVCIQRNTGQLSCSSQRVFE